jgi:acyl-coenzyme A synthetase/AMP-(fatty) acid ligase
VILTSVEGDRHTDSAGRIGELYLRSDVMMLGMVRREQDDVFQDGWYPTNDLVSFRDGHLHYEGRADDLIKAHGANVSPREVEAVLAAIPGVASANCIGIPDKERGTAVAAAVVPEPGVTLDVEALRKQAAEALASYKLPRVIKILAASDLPMLPSSKVDRISLARLLSDAAR